MTEPIPPRCKCDHSQWIHLADLYHCRSRSCGCRQYRPKEVAK